MLPNNIFMSTIKVTSSTKNYLDIHKKKSVDEAINSLLDFVEPIMDDYLIPVEREHIVHVNKSTMKRIKGFRTKEYESYNSILDRLINVAIEFKYDED